MLKRSFYHFMMRYRDAKFEVNFRSLAYEMYCDHSFPIQSTDYDEVCRYIEESGTYDTSMAVVDEAWKEYESTTIF